MFTITPHDDKFRAEAAALQVLANELWNDPRFRHILQVEIVKRLDDYVNQREEIAKAFFDGSVMIIDKSRTGPEFEMRGFRPVVKKMRSFHGTVNDKETDAPAS